MYLGTVVHAPSGEPGRDGARFPFHNWDLEAASATFAFYQRRPAPADEAFGRSVAAAWRQLAA